MEQMRTKVLLALLALAVALGSASLAQAQVTYTVTTVPTFVINTGRAEVMGSVRITAVNNAAGAATIASTIQYTFQSIGCDIAASTAGNLLTSADFAAAAVQTTTNTSAGCVVSVTVPAAVVVVNSSSFVEMRNMRGRIDLLGGITNVGQNIYASLSATPANSSLFTVPNQGVVGITAVGLEFVSATTGTVLQCLGAASTQPALSYREGFNGAFVQHVITARPTAVPANIRPVAAAVNNTQVRLVVTGLPTGVTLTWPSNVEGNLAAAFAAGVSGSRMERTTTSTATSQTYEYACGDQAVCDLNQETFNYTAANPNAGSGGAGTAAITLTATATSAFGTATVQIRLFPDLITGDATSITSAVAAAGVARPRFNDPLRPSPAATLAINAPCRTSLLWPFVPSRYPQGSTSTGAAQPGSFDTGLVVADTGFDNPAFVQGTTDFGANAPPAGSCRWYAFQQLSTHDASTGASGTGTPTSPTAVTRGPIKAGDSDVILATAVVGTSAWQGYMITVCDFQFAHGFAFVFQNALTAGQLPVSSQGYLPLVIPDPVVRGGRVANDPSCIGAAGAKLVAVTNAGVTAAAFPFTVPANTNVTVVCAQAGEGLVQ